MDFEEWAALGLEKGWVGPTICYTHDGLPLTGDEEDEFDEGDPCVHIFRLYDSLETKKAVEENHAASVWRQGPKNV